MYRKSLHWQLHCSLYIHFSSLCTKLTAFCLCMRKMTLIFINSSSWSSPPILAFLDRNIVAKAGHVILSNTNYGYMLYRSKYLMDAFPSFCFRWHRGQGHTRWSAFFASLLFQRIPWSSWGETQLHLNTYMFRWEIMMSPQSHLLYRFRCLRCHYH